MFITSRRKESTGKKQIFMQFYLIFFSLTLVVVFYSLKILLQRYLKKCICLKKKEIQNISS